MRTARLILIAAMAALPAAVLAGPGTGPRCLALHDVVGGGVEDDSTIVFRMRDRTAFVTHLVPACQGLKDYGYRTRQTEDLLCAHAQIEVRVLRHTCILGSFEPMK